MPARGGRSCEHFGRCKTINRIPLTFTFTHISAMQIHHRLLPGLVKLEASERVAAGRKLVIVISIMIMSTSIHQNRNNGQK